MVSQFWMLLEWELDHGISNSTRHSCIASILSTRNNWMKLDEAVHMKIFAPCTSVFGLDRSSFWYTENHECNSSNWLLICCLENDTIQFGMNLLWIYLGLSPLPVTVANEGLYH